MGHCRDGNMNVSQFIVCIVFVYLLHRLFFNIYSVAMVMYPVSPVIEVMGYLFPALLVALSVFFIAKRAMYIKKNVRLIVSVWALSAASVYLTCLGLTRSILYDLYEASFLLVLVSFVIPPFTMVSILVYCLYANKEKVSFLSVGYLKVLCGYAVLFFMVQAIGFKPYSIYEYIPPKRLEQLAVRGEASEALRVAYSYAAGVGLPKDIAKAVYWYEMAYSKGHKAAIYNAAVLLEEAGNKEKSREYLHISERLGVEPAFYTIRRGLYSGSIYRQSLSSMCEEEKKDFRCNLAMVEQPERQYNYARSISEKSPLFINAIYWYEEATRRGHPRAREILIAHLFQGPYSVRNASKAQSLCFQFGCGARLRLLNKIFTQRVSQEIEGR